MSTIQDEDIRIYQLPEVQELSVGMKVAVDSETDGTKSFDIETALGEKVDAPSTTPEAGQVLTFDGTNNVWANAPEGVYVLNYSEVTDIRDVDIVRVRTQPTFLKIDTEQPLTISVPNSSYTVNVQPGTIMGLEEIGANGTSGTYTGPKFLIFGSKFGEEVGGGIMQNADLRVICCIALSAFGGVSKGLTVNGNMDPGGQLFGSPSSPGSQPFPITTSFFVGKGPGDPNTNRTQNALGVEFQSAGKIRKQVLMPEDVESHDFSTDTTPEQIQFMGWGATSNRAGYKTILSVKDTTDSSTYPEQTTKLELMKYQMSSSTPASDQIGVVLQTTMKSADGQTTEVIGGNLVPSISNAGVLQVWSDSNGSHYGWKPVNEVPASTAQDEGKVLTVDSNGAAAWSNISTSDFVLVTGSTGAEKATNCQAIIDAGKIPVYNAVIYDNGHPYNQIMVYMYSDDNNFYFMGINPKYYKDGVQQFIAYQNDVRITFYRTSKTTFGNGYTERGLDDLLSDSVIRSDVNSINVRNNRLTIVPTSYTTGKSSLTINIVEGEMTNAAIELNPDTNMTVTVVKKGPSDITLKYSVAAGNTLEAGKYYQITAVGNCWTLAEFES